MEERKSDFEECYWVLARRIAKLVASPLGDMPSDDLRSALKDIGFL